MLSPLRALLLLALPLLPVAGLKSQEPAGIHRFKMGALEALAIQDGETKLSQDLLKGIDAKEAAQLLGGSDSVTTSVNTFLVRLDAGTVLVDAGGPATMGCGHLVERLAQAGVKPEAIDAILITHLHVDHVSALLAKDGSRAFPRAQIRLAQAEHTYWSAPERESRLPETWRPMVRAVKAALAPYQAAGAYRPFAPGEAPFPGVTAIPIPGHTPGHTAYAFRKGSVALWAVGDLIHFAKVQFPYPDVAVFFDTDTTQAIASRRKVLDQAAQEGAVLAGSHLDFPGIGRVETQSSGFAWRPLP